MGWPAPISPDAPDETLDQIIEKEHSRKLTEFIEILYPNAPLENKVSRAYESQNFPEFDGQIGDELCEVRALMIAERVMDRLEDLQTACYLLTKSCVLAPDEKGFISKSPIDKDILQKTSGVSSKKRAQELQNSAQRFVAACTVKYLQQCTLSLGAPNLSRALQIIYRDNSQRLVPLFYPAVKVMILTALQQRVPIIFKIKRYCAECQGVHIKSFVFKANINASEYVLCAPEEIGALFGTRALVYESYSIPEELFDLETKGFISIFSGINFKKQKPYCPDAQIFFDNFPAKLERIGGLKTLIIADAAQHKQLGFRQEPEDTQREFTCSELTSAGLTDLALEINSLNELAQKNGFSRQNPTFVLIEHIYANTIR
jgi:hypothetical protein